MEYNFSGMCADQTFLLKKRIDALNERFKNQYAAAINLINCALEDDKRIDMSVEISDLLNDQANQCEILYTNTMNKVVQVLHRYL